MKYLGATLAILAMTACSSAARITTTTEYNSASQEVANFWTGIIFTAFIVCVGLSIITWAIAYAVTNKNK